MRIQIWVQLYIENKGKKGGPFSIDFTSLNNDSIEDFAEAVCEKRPKALGHCEAADLVVFEAGTEFPFTEENKLEPDDNVPKDTTAKNPLRVVAPAVAQYEQGRSLGFLLMKFLA